MPRKTSAAHRTKTRRALATAAAVAALVAPPLARAQSPDVAGWRIGPAFGFESGGLGGEDFSAAKLRIDVQRPISVLAPNTSLGLVVSLGASHPSGSYSFTIPTGFYTFESFNVTWDANVFEVTAAARITRTLTPRMSLFADGGLGVNHAVARVVLPAQLTALGATSAVGDGTGGTLRLAGGAVFTPSANVHIGVELVGLHIRFGEGAETGFGMLLSISHRL